MAKKMTIKVLCCLVVIAILMSTMPASVFALGDRVTATTQLRSLQYQEGTELGYDDGEVDGYAGSGRDGYAVFFSNDKKQNINGIKICGGRYDDTSREFDIEIWDNNLKTLYSATYDYTDFFPVSYTPLDYSDLKWVTIDVPNIEVTGNFYVAIFTYSRPFSWGKNAHLQAPKGGIAIGHDSNTKFGNSFVVVKDPNRFEEWPTNFPLQENTDWMIRAVVYGANGENHAPVITTITADPSVVSQGGPSTITVVASDLDGDELSYTYEPTGGEISGDGSVVTWTADVAAPGAPPIVGKFKIDVTVSDGKASVSDSVDIILAESTELGYDDGEVDGYASSGSDGYAVFFSNDGKLNVNGIRICGARYDDTTREFDVELWDENFKTLYTASYDYTDFFPESTPLDYSDLKWVTIDVPNIEVINNFYVVIFTYGGPWSWYKGAYELPALKGGIVIGRDFDTKSGNSFVVNKFPNNTIVDWPTNFNIQEDTDWMIRAMVAIGSSIEPPEEIPTNLVVTVQSPSNDFSVLRGAPLTVSAKITDNLENFVKASLVKATFTNGDDDQILLDDGLHNDGSADDGVYANTWTPQTTAQGYTETACTITVIASHGTLSQGSAYVSGEVISPPVSITIEDFGITPPTRNFPANGPITAGINDKIGIWYSIKNTDTFNRDVKLITKIRNRDTGEIIPDPTSDKVVTLSPSDTRWYSRSFVIPSGTKAGTYDVLYSIYKPDQSDNYDETWKAGWLIVDTDTYTVSLRSSANDGSLNIGSIRVDTATHNLPSEVTKQYRMNEYYYVEAIPPMGYNFDKWETFGGVSVNDIGNGFGILSVRRAGTLNAVLKNAPTFEIILNPTSISLNPGEKGSTLVNVKSLNGFSGSVELTLGWDEASGNWFSNVNFDPKIVTMTSGEQVISELSFDLSSSATPGVYNMHVGATDLQRQCQSKYENLQLSVKGTTTQDPVLENWEITPTMAKAGDTVELHYYLYNPNSQSLEVTLGVTMRDSNGQEMVDKNNDIDVTLTPGRNWYKRSFDIKPTAATGYYDVMWGFHKAHLAGMYGNSGWLENRLKVVTFGELLDDLAKAEEELYQSSISLVNHYDRVMVCDFVHYSIVFDSDLGTETAALVIQMGVPIPVVYAIVEGIMAVKMVYPEAEAISAQNTCIKDDQKYLQTRDLLRSGFPENNPEFNLKDKECIDNINIKHQDFQSFLVDGYGVADKDRDKLALIIENEILLLNKANSELFLAKTQPIFYGDDPIGWTLVYHDKYDKTIRRVPLASRSGYKVSVVIATLGMFGACALTGPGVVACAPVLVAGSIGGYAGNRIIDAGLYEAGLSFISDEANGINTDLQNIDNYYTSLLTETENKLNLVESIPQGKIISLNGENSEVGKLTTLNVKFSNIGTKNLQAKGYFNLFYNGNYLATITTGSKNIKSGVTEDISTTIMPELAGTYVVNCYVQYDNMKSDTLSTQISVAPVTSAIVVNTNNANAKFTIIGLQSFSGDGTSWSTTEALIGTYKIIFDPIEGYDTPPSQELELTPDSTITFTGDYIQQTITYSITLNSNRADIPLIVDGKVIYHDELPKTFTWSKNSEHTIKAQTEVYKEASTKYVFVKWDDGNTDSERTITVNSDKTYNAEYKTRYYLSLKTNPENIGAVFGAGWYDVNSPAEITAPVIPGYAFTGWTVDDSTVVGNLILVSMDSSHNAVANYVSTDTSLPTVIGNTPTGSDVPVNTPMTISFSEAMNTESAQSAFYTSPATIGSFSWSGNTMAYTPSSNLVSDTTYIVTVGTGATDLTGNNLQSPYSWQFTTASIEPKLCTNTIGMEFVLIPAGKFEMGSPSDEEGRFEDEGPIHQVTIGNALYMGRYEVTQQQWRAVMGDNPSCFTGDDDLPVECVSWDDVQEFIRKLNDKEGTTKYRLPSEAEWEYVCRAGTTTRYSFGDDESELGDYAWYDDNSNDKTHPVGQKKPNPWGLYDMHGNVWEWVQDCWHSNYNGALADGSAWVYSCKYDGADRVYRGGGWFGDSRGCRSAIRDDRGCGFGVRCVDLGFRILKEQ